jgi:Meiotically up-regulated gene 113
MNSIYLMKNMANGYYKIGSSGHPFNRERTLQSQEPDIRLLAHVEGDKTLERKLHQRLAPNRVRGEWFSLSFGDLCQLRHDFNVELTTIDPPISVLVADWWRASIYRYSPTSHRTWVTQHNDKFLFEAPFAMSRAEVADQALLESESSYVSDELWDVLSISLRNYIRDLYEVDGMTVELREICCLSTGDSRGFLVTERHYAHHRYFSRQDPARRYYAHMRRYLDGYARVEGDI